MRRLNSFGKFRLERSNIKSVRYLVQNFLSPPPIRNPSNTPVEYSLSLIDTDKV